MKYTEIQWSTCILIPEFKQWKIGARKKYNPGPINMETQHTKFKKLHFYMEPHLCGDWIEGSNVIA